MVGYLTSDDFASIPAEDIGDAVVRAEPVVSVLMITWNHEEFVGEAIEAILEQELDRPFELIIGEDCSTDQTRSICEGFQQRYPDRIRLVSSPQNVGMHRNLCRIWSRARGKYLAFCEGDDYWCDKEKLAKQIGWLDDHPEHTLCGTYAVKIRQDEGGLWQESGAVGPRELKTAYGLADLIPRYSFHFSTVCLRKEVVRFPRWLWDVYCVDRPLYLFCAERGPVGCIPDVTSVYRLHESGVWAPIKPSEKAEKSVHLFEEIDRHLGHRFHPLIRQTLAGILWSYMSEALDGGDRASARKLYRGALTYGMELLSLRQRIAVFLRLYAPALYSGLRHLRLRSQNAHRIRGNEYL